MISAYNLDLDTDEMLIGEKLSIERPTGLAAVVVLIIVMTSVPLFLIVVQSVANNRNLSESKLRFFVIVPRSGANAE